MKGSNFDFIVLPNTHTEIINFWFNEIDRKLWWVKDPEFDQIIKTRFLGTHNAAINCELYYWRSTPSGRLAEIIVLDQFSRNIYRDNSLAFNYDALALALSQEAINVSAQHELNADEKAFLFMPFMHSESVKIHEIALSLYAEKGMESNLEFEKKHKLIIDRFGRYPHRNEILGRISTQDEINFLKEPGSSF